MKKLATLVLASLLSVTGLSAWEQTLKANDLEVKIKSVGNPTKGENTFVLNPTLKGKALEKAQVRVQFLMPEMPGMPAMKEMAKVSEKDGAYEAKANLSMSGTWQVKVDIKSKEGKTYRTKTSVDL
ncbi:copper resistance determinant CrdA [Helicobacter cetorum]|uniref:copper resistance determinant CrdA n=1 Tax=Helicobacter cetorum TaxID=138563 RepID=UPI000CF0F1D5|nr:copper resistance determinant CrdA [Helicobacter cetorum]